MRTPFTTRILWPVLLLFHFGLMLIFNLTNSLQSHLELYSKEASYFPRSMEMIGMVQRFIEPAKSWQLLTGTRTGYGFYAPQVSSHIEPFFDIYHDEAMVSPYFRLTFSTHEAGLRFQTVFDQHLEKLDQLLAGKELDSINTDLYYRSLDLRVHSLSTSVLNLLPAGIDANRVRASLYLYEVPPLYAVTRLREPFRQAFLKTFDYDYRLHPQ